MDLVIHADVVNVYCRHFSSHLQKAPVDLKTDTAAFVPPGADLAGGVVAGAPPPRGFHRAVVALGAAPAAGAGRPAEDKIGVQVRSRSPSILPDHSLLPPVPGNNHASPIIMDAGTGLAGIWRLSPGAVIRPPHLP